MPSHLHTFLKRSPMPASAEELFRWHEAPGAFEKLTPPGEKVAVLERAGGIRDGARVVVRVGRWPFAFRWVLEHCEYVQGRQFCDVQIRGPFRFYKHYHRMDPVDPDHSILEDRVEFALPLAPLSSWIAAPLILRKFEQLFAYRHRVTFQALQASRTP